MAYTILWPIAYTGLQTGRIIHGRCIMAIAHQQEKILETARTLYNEKGPSAVSMRELAEACGMAVGNLTYYYHRKEDLLRAIMQDAFITTKPEPPIHTLADLNDQFSRMLDTIVRYAFYFLDDTFLQDQKDHNSAIQLRILEGFEFLRAEGIFCSSFSREIQQQILSMLLLTHLSWLRLKLRGGRSIPKDEFLRRHWLILRPYLTDRGRAEYENTLKDPPLI